MADKYISQFPTHTPVGSDFLAVEDSSETGKATINNIVAASNLAGAALQRGGAVPTNTNLDNFLDAGVYCMVSANTYTGAPSGVTVGMLLVLVPMATSQVYITQILVSYSGNVYVRLRQTDSWTAWKTL